MFTYIKLTIGLVLIGSILFNFYQGSRIDNLNAELESNQIIHKREIDSANSTIQTLRDSIDEQNKKLFELSVKTTELELQSSELRNQVEENKKPVQERVRTIFATEIDKSCEAKLKFIRSQIQKIDW